VSATIPESPVTFRAAFCGHYGVTEEEFATGLFWECIPASRRPVAWLILRLNPRYFEDELLALKAIGLAQSPDEVQAEFTYLRELNRQNQRPLKELFGVRISGRRLFRIQNKIFRAKA